jgi:putative ABC transport system permease protein
MRSLTERAGVAVYRGLQRLVLPADLRQRAGEEMVTLFEARHRRATRVSWPVGWWHEFAGLLVASVRARLEMQSEARRSRMNERRRSGGMERYVQDVRYAIRSLTRRPAVTALAVMALGLGIAASTAMFSVVNAVLLKPLPYEEAGQLVSVYTRNVEFEGHPTLGFAAERGSFSWPELRVLREEGRDVLDGVAMVFWGGTGTLYGSGEPERIALARTTPDLFTRVLRTRPLVGRVLNEEDARTRANVVLLEEGFWQRRFGADPGVVGTVIQLGDTPYTVIGVVPGETSMPKVRADAWLLETLVDNWDNHMTGAIGRLQRGVSPEQGSARLSALLAGAVPAGHAEHGVNLFPLQADETRTVKGPLLLLGLASLVLLAVACGNVAALLVGAAIDREQEFAVRAALGAGRRRLVRQMLTESALLGLAAAAFGLLLALLVTRGLVLLAPQGVPRIDEAVIDGRALVFAIVVAVGCGFLFGMVPALGFSRTDLRRSMTITTRSVAGTRSRIQGAVVVGELALATVLLVGAGLLARTLLALSAVDLGFAAHETLSIRTSIPASRIADPDAPDSVRMGAFDQFYLRLADEMGALSGVTGVTLTSNLPLSGDRGNNGVELEGYDESVVAERRFVSANYFEVMGIRIVDGRAFSNEEDRAGVPGAVVVSEGLARRAWPGESAVGKRFRYWDVDNIIVGVAADVRDEEMHSGTTFAFYAPRRNARQYYGTFVLRTTVDPITLVPALRARLRTIHPDLVIASAEPLTSLVSEQIASERYRARLILVFSTLAALFSLMGIYGVTARNVAARTREMGIRVALGARQKGILGLVVGQAIRLAVIGAAIGIAISFVATRGLEAYLWGVERTDALTLITIALALAGASVIAALAPGMRAARVDPIEALRAD